MGTDFRRRSSASQYVAFLLTQDDHTVLAKNMFWAIRKWRKSCHYACRWDLGRHFDALKNQKEVGKLNEKTA